ncbi:putative Pollike protein, partial [Globisporangium polare]
DVLHIIDLHKKKVPRNELLAAILRASPPPPPTVELLLETKGELRAQPYDALLESLAVDQSDNPELKALLLTGAVVQVAKKPDGNLAFHVHSTEAREALRKHRVNLCGGTYRFKVDEALDCRFFFDAVNFTVGEDIPGLVQHLLDVGFAVVSCVTKVSDRETGTSSPMIRVYTDDFKTPAIATINGQPMDQILYAGKSFMANCKG